MISSDTRSQIFEKKNCGPNLGKTGLNQALNEAFCYFLEFGSLIFFDIAYSNSLQQFLTFSRDKTHEKNFRAHIWSKGDKIGPKMRFFAIISSLVH